MEEGEDLQRAPSPGAAPHSPPPPAPQLPPAQAPPLLRPGHHSAEICSRREQLGLYDDLESEPLDDPCWDREWSSAPPSPGGHLLLHESASAPCDVGDTVGLLRSSFRLNPSKLECREALEHYGGDAEAAHRHLRCCAAARLATNGTLDRRAEHDERRSFIDARRAVMYRRLQEIECEEAELRQRLAAAQECGAAGAAARFHEELEALEQEELDVKISACAAIHNRTNEHSFGFETVDLHGQHATHALDVVRHVVRCNTSRRPPYRLGTFLVFFIVGRGLHSGEGGAVLPGVVMKELERHGVEHELLALRGTVCATFRADADAISSPSDSD